jgi:hypothetical protein
MHRTGRPARRRPRRRQATDTMGGQGEPSDVMSDKA